MHPGHQPGLIGSDLKEELQPRDGRIERDRRGAVVDQVRLLAPQVLDGRRVGVTPEKARKLLHSAKVVALGLFQPPAPKRSLLPRERFSPMAGWRLRQNGENRSRPAPAISVQTYYGHNVR